MTNNVVVVDYGIGNVRSVCHALEHCGATVTLTGDIARIAGADRLVLPGVGAIGHCLSELDQRRLREPLARYAETGRPLLGICVGMQMMLQIGHEFGRTECFGWIRGEVVQVPSAGASGVPHRIPHIGWAGLHAGTTGPGWDDSILRDVEPGSHVYFVHSFMAAPTDPADRLADTAYDGVPICAAVQKGAISGTQFHPEKSGEVGLRILRNFLAS